MERLLIVLILVLLILPTVFASDYSKPINNNDKIIFDEILKPLMDIYKLVKYASSTVAVLMLVFSGITFITGGNDMAKRESAKTMAGYIIVGLIIIWVAPLIVGYFTQ